MRDEHATDDEAQRKGKPVKSTENPGNGGAVPITCPGGENCSVAVQASATLASIHATLRGIAARDRHMEGMLERLIGHVGELATRSGVTDERVERMETQLGRFTADVARSTVDAMRSEMSEAIKYEVERLAPRGGVNG